MRFPVLRSNTDFRTLYYRGKSRVDPALITYIRRSRLKDGAGRPVIRMGITAGKKVGRAVDRSRCRRMIRAAYSALYPSLSGGYDIVIVARPRMLKMKSTQLIPVLQAHFKEAGML